DLPLPVLDQREGGGLHPPGGEDLPAAAARGEGEEPRKDGPPREVDDLPRGGGRREALVELPEVVERVDELGAGERGKPRPPHLGYPGRLVDDADRLEPDQLALPVVVRRHD